MQVLDELNVAKPCIDMADEGYNCEWSQELKLDQSFEEYLKAFVLLYVLRDMLNLPVETEPGKGPGFIFNMSAGYNLEGIKSPALQRFLDRMENAEEDVKRIKAGLAPLSPARAKAMINRLQAAKLLQGFRGKQPADIAALEETLVRLGRMAHALGERLVSLDLNPLMVLPEGQGVRIVDIVMQARPSGDSPKHLP